MISKELVPVVYGNQHKRFVI